MQKTCGLQNWHLITLRRFSACCLVSLQNKMSNIYCKSNGEEIRLGEIGITRKTKSKFKDHSKVQLKYLLCVKIIPVKLENKCFTIMKNYN